MDNANKTRTVDMGNSESVTLGVVKQTDGTYLALTYSRSKSFKRERNAWAWYRAAMGFGA
ncbi:MAG TPA: DUF1391 family protein [Polyangiales bacterium]|jgi:hypothetical protein|nr:DUF1391 family protein [Polyangiales bacterium]